MSFDVFTFTVFFSVKYKGLLFSLFTPLVQFLFFFLFEMIVLLDELLASRGNCRHTYLISLYFSPLYHWA